MTIEQRIKNLSVPEGKIDVVLDTDAYNEIDDQFAIAYLYLAPSVELLAVNAVHYMHDRCNSKEVGMKRSYDEIVKVLSLADPHYTTKTYRGSINTIDETGSYVESDAADAIIRIARESDEMVYVVAIGALTNVTSAILKAPDIKEKICVVFVGCRPLPNRNPEGGQGLCCKPEKRKRPPGWVVFLFLTSCTEKDIIHKKYILWYIPVRQNKY